MSRDEIGEVTFEGQVTCETSPLVLTELDDCARLASSCFRMRVISSGEGGQGCAGMGEPRSAL